jgi:hypothetical protein
MKITTYEITIRTTSEHAAARKNGKKGGRPKIVVTAGMGSCHCGDCYVRVFSDGTIQYQGSEKWQRSDRRPFMGDDEPYRPYNSRLTVEAYQKATARQTAMR